MIRLATAADAAAIAAIYAPFCAAESHVSFETTPPTEAEMAGRIAQITRHHPWLVAEAPDGRLAGYVYASPHRERAAYRWSVDVTAYLHPDFRRQGLGRQLYHALFALLRAQGYYRAHAGIAEPNPASTALHRALGFTLVGTYREVGFKAGAWRDVSWYQLALQPSTATPAEPLPLSALANTDAFAAALGSDAAVS